LHQTAALGQFVKAFEKEGIEAISLKGPILAQSLYGNIADRHYSDLDVLTRGEKISEVIQIAKKQGFDIQSPRADLSDKQWDYYFRHKKDIYLFHKEQGIFVELHTRIENRVILHPSKVDIFLQDLIEVPCGPAVFRSMNQHHTFLYLVLHGAIHQYFRLFWLRDVAEAMKSWDLDHGRILSDSKSLGIELMLGVSLELASHLFSVTIPEEYQNTLSENHRILGKLTNSSLRVILGPENTSFSGRFRSHLYTFRLHRGIARFSRIVLEVLHRAYIRKFLSR